MFDPFLKYSPLSQFKEVGFTDKFRKWNTKYVWFNLLIPAAILMMMVFIFRKEHIKRKELYNEYVPPHLNKYADWN